MAYKLVFGASSPLKLLVLQSSLECVCTCESPGNRQTIITPLTAACTAMRKAPFSQARQMVCVSVCVFVCVCVSECEGKRDTAALCLVRHTQEHFFEHIVVCGKSLVTLILNDTIVWVTADTSLNRHQHVGRDTLLLLVCVSLDTHCVWTCVFSSTHHSQNV